MTSIRVASQTRWIKENPGADVIASVLLFWVIALVLSRMPSRDAPPNDHRRPGGILLR